MAVLTLRFNSRAVGLATAVRILFPTGVETNGGKVDFKAAYAAKKPLPVLWLLHGGSDNYSDWHNYTRVQQLSDEYGYAVVMPDAQTSSYANMAYGPNWLDYFTEELPEYLYARFNFSRERKDNFIAGMSMGGSGTVKLALLHPERYSVAVPLASAVEVARRYAEGRWDRIPGGGPHDGHPSAFNDIYGLDHDPTAILGTAEDCFGLLKNSDIKMKYLKFTLLFILVMPLIVMAEEKVSTNELEVVGETTKYYKTVTILNDSEIMSIVSPEVTSFTTEITKEEYDSVDLNELYQLNGSTTVQTDYKKMTTTMSQHSSYYRYSVDLTWKNIPKVRSHDIIAIGHYSTVEPISGPIITQSYCEGNGECYEGAESSIITGVNGTAVVFAIPTGTLTSLSQSMYFNVKKSGSGTVKNQRAAGDYAHATKTITRDNAKKLRVDIAGIIHDSSVESYYDTIGAAIVDWTGSW